MHNNANQRTSVTNADGTYWLYGYDALGQVTSGVEYFDTGVPVPGEQFGYAYDNIGNRTSTTAGGDQNGGNLRTATYGANLNNQYTNRTVPGAVDILSWRRCQRRTHSLPVPAVQMLGLGEVGVAPQADLWKPAWRHKAMARSK